jgi:hypothetical protein
VLFKTVCSQSALCRQSLGRNNCAKVTAVSVNKKDLQD